MRTKRLELLHLAVLEPKSSASTNSATSAYIWLIIILAERKPKLTLVPLRVSQKAKGTINNQQSTINNQQTTNNKQQTTNNNLQSVNPFKAYKTCAGGQTLDLARNKQNDLPT